MRIPLPNGPTVLHELTDHWKQFMRSSGEWEWRLVRSCGGIFSAGRGARGASPALTSCTSPLTGCSRCLSRPRLSLQGARGKPRKSAPGCHTAQVHEPHVYPVLMAAIATGMRRGELLALRWEDIGEEEIRGRSALVRGKIKTPKSDKARSVPIYPELRTVLEDLRRTRKKREGLTGPGLVFTSPVGGIWDEDKFGWAWRRLRTAYASRLGGAPSALRRSRFPPADRMESSGRRSSAGSCPAC